jgi:hypothetical protein
MRNGKENNSCLFGEELISYIYGELELRRQAAFEDHLLDCSGCTEAFAELSVSRLGVYEWRRDEFEPIATPHFAIPYEKARLRNNWVDAVRGLLVSPLRVGFAGAAIAALVFAFVFAINYPPVDETAGVTVAKPALPDAPPVSPSQFKVSDENSEGLKTMTLTAKDRRSAKPLQRTLLVQSKAIAPKKRTTIQAADTRSAPRLGNFVDTEDNSLRLADLVADIDTKD